jgi:hypothetical protein
VIVLSIAPGIRALAWAIVQFRGRSMSGELVASDVEHHGNKSDLVGGFADLLSRARVHWLILSVLLDRHAPGVLVIGEPFSKREPPEHVEAMRCLLRSLFLSVGIPVVEFDGRDEVLSVLGTNQRTMVLAAEEMIGRPLLKPERPTMGALLAAAASARILLELPVRPAVRVSRATDVSYAATTGTVGVGDGREVVRGGAGDVGRDGHGDGPRGLPPVAPAPVTGFSPGRAGAGRGSDDRSRGAHVGARGRGGPAS